MKNRERKKRQATKLAAFRDKIEPHINAIWLAMHEEGYTDNGESLYMSIGADSYVSAFFRGVPGELLRVPKFDGSVIAVETRR